MTPEELRLASCEGKEAFATPALAWAVQERRTRRPKRGRQYRDNEPYRCPHCGKWHIGRAAKR